MAIKKTPLLSNVIQPDVAPGEYGRTTQETSGKLKWVTPRLDKTGIEQTESSTNYLNSSDSGIGSLS